MGKESDYNPIVSLRRDFGPRHIYRDRFQKPVIDDADLHTIMQFYRQSVRPGPLLDVGAGTTHFHYMTAFEDRVSSIAALDLSPKNIEFLIGWWAWLRGERADEGFPAAVDRETFMVLVEAISRDSRYGTGRRPETMISNLARKSTRKDGSSDLIFGDMYDLTSIKEQKDTIILGFALYVPTNLTDLERLFHEAGSRLVSGGRLLIADFKEFGEENLAAFQEDPVVLSRYHTDYYLDGEVLKRALITAGFTKVTVEEQSPEEGIEKERNLVYLFAVAEK